MRQQQRRAGTVHLVIVLTPSRLSFGMARSHQYFPDNLAIIPALPHSSAILSPWEMQKRKTMPASAI